MKLEPHLADAEATYPRGTLLETPAGRGVALFSVMVGQTERVLVAFGAFDQFHDVATCRPATQLDLGL